MAPLKADVPTPTGSVRRLAAVVACGARCGRSAAFTGRRCGVGLGELTRGGWRDAEPRPRRRVAGRAVVLDTEDPDVAGEHHRMTATSPQTDFIPEPSILTTVLAGTCPSNRSGCAMVAVPAPWVGAEARVWICGLGEPYLPHPVASVTAQQSGLQARDRRVRLRLWRPTRRGNLASCRHSRCSRPVTRAGSCPTAPRQVAAFAPACAPS